MDSFDEDGDPGLIELTPDDLARMVAPDPSDPAVRHICLGGNEAHLPGVRPRRTPDAELRECLARLVDADEAFALELSVLPDPAHARYHERMAAVVDSHLECLGEIRRALLGGK